MAESLNRWNNNTDWAQGFVAVSVSVTLFASNIDHIWMQLPTPNGFQGRLLEVAGYTPRGHLAGGTRIRRQV